MTQKESPYLSWYCANDQHGQCYQYHPRVLGRCECECHLHPDSEADSSDG